MPVYIIGTEEGEPVKIGYLRVKAAARVAAGAAP